MPSGGKRIGSGRPKGAASRTNEEVRARALASGESPLDYMLRVMRDEEALAARRDDMAKAAAPYLHSKLVPAAEWDASERQPIVVHLNSVDSRL